MTNYRPARRPEYFQEPRLLHPTPVNCRGDKKKGEQDNPLDPFQDIRSTVKCPNLVSRYYNPSKTDGTVTFLVACSMHTFL